MNMIARMVRPKSRKTVEEVYTSVPPQQTMAASRYDDSFLQNPKNIRYMKTTEKADFSTNSVACRKKSKQLTAQSSIGSEKKDEKTFTNQERLFRRSSKIKKLDQYSSSGLDNKSVTISVEDIEKDEDVDDFFDLIKVTVEHTVETTVSDILNRSFKEVCAKVDTLREDLRASETKLEKIQIEINQINKSLAILPEIVHYGEENSRHFRYLCMKSEYDKMFQHQNLIATIPVDIHQNALNAYSQQFNLPGNSMPQPVHLVPQQRQQAQQQPQQQPVQQPALLQPQQPIQCMQPFSMPVSAQNNCHGSGCGDCCGVERAKSTTSTKSSDVGIKEVKDLLEQLHKFYEQQSQEQSDKKDMHGDINLNLQDDSGDFDDDIESSEELSSPSIEEQMGTIGNA